MTKRLELLTPAKINLFLRITGRRPDGYHELDSLFLPVSLFDRIVIEAGQADSIAVPIRCNWPEIPLDDNNLAVRAARLFLEHSGLRWRVKIDLHKQIPAGAGLGGGSSDAGGVLRMMARLHEIEPAALAAIALRLGADVPFFLNPRPARVAGVGEQITYLDGECRLHMAIGVPPVSVPTAEIYRYLERRRWSGPGPGTVPMPLEVSRLTPGLMLNDLESVAAARYPPITQVKALLQNLGAMGSAMSGSGGAVFALFPSESEARRAAETASAQMPEARFFAARVIQ
ncbi:MAG TPA: 4-(cytidine 5'-diphospho)-2-C-methyl-D-erythritol kinase [Candidatus Binataceae bacterium]